ncbi:MAG TPA: histidine phosphatase family protein [Planctomycetota bacterium]|nr:histidine phosphatase family protein [Planctomycetota bacterium]
MPGTTSRTLYVIRHGEAAPSRPHADDFGRPLTDKGARDVLRLGALVQDAPPAVVWASPAERARRTAEALVASSTKPLPAPTFEPRIYGATLDALYDVLRATPDDVASAALVGHNPGLDELVRSLSPDDAASLGEIPPGSLVRFAVDGAWSKLRPRGAARTGFQPP